MLGRMSPLTVIALRDAPAPPEALRVSVPELGTGPLAARLCAQLASAAPTPPLAMIARGTDTALLPAVAVAQRAAGRQVLGYVLVDPDAIEVTEAWPDARVAVVGNPDLARLRGWDALDSEAEVATWLAALQG